MLLNFRATTSTRKLFHLLTVLVYVPGLLYERTLLYLASGIIMGLFVFLEVDINFNYSKIPTVPMFLNEHDYHLLPADEMFENTAFWTGVATRIFRACRREG